MNLKAQAHHLKPIVRVGKNGMTDALIVEIDAALKAHELIKIKFEESALKIMQNDPSNWLTKLKAKLVGTQGHIMILHREN